MRGVWIVAAVALTAAMLVACGPQVPTIENLELDPSPSEAVPLAALVTFQTDLPTTVRFEIEDGDGVRTLDARMPAITDHVVPVLGLKPGRTHSVRVVVTSVDGGVSISEPLEVTTDPLPEDFPPLDIRVSDPDRMEPGFTLVEAAYLPGDGSPQDNQYLMALDARGDVVWYYRAAHGVGDAQRIANGHFLYRTGNTHLYEIDVLGNIVSHWASDLAPDDQVTDDTIRVATDALHHEALEMPSGNLMALSTEVRSIENYPTSETDPNAAKATSNVVGDVIVEITRDGKILREIRLHDLFDPYRIGYGSLGGFWAGTYQGRTTAPRDWSHANGIALDESGQYLLVSMRHQGAVAKIDLATEDVVWILGDHGGWGTDWQELLLEPDGELIWSADQHAPMFTGTGTVLMFDNGTNRALPFDTPMAASESFSRGVEYEIDEENMTVREVWTYGDSGEDRFYAWRVGDADWMPETGNVLLTYGGMSDDEDGNSLSGNGHNWIRIVEVTHDQPAEEVFELIIDDERPRGWLSFQAERLPSLYP